LHLHKNLKLPLFVDYTHITGMSESENMIEAYIQTLLRIQEEQKERPLDEQEMKRIAYDLGMSEDDIELIQKKMSDYVARGKGYSRYEDWESAIEEFGQAISLAPNHLEALFGIANAYKHRWLLKGDKDDFHQAKYFAKKALQVNPHHDASFRLASELNKGTTKYRPSDPFSNFKNINKDFDKLRNDVKIKDSFLQEALRFDSNRRLKKSNRDKKIFGVCGGIAEYFGIDPTWIRVAFIVGTLFGAGSPVPLYIILAFILPKS
jgi:phage shock protein PspC (stress-responsive transcriptional regulator)